MKIKTCALLLALLAPASALAAGPCDNATTQAQLNQCSAVEAQQADTELNATYREVMARLKGQPVAIEKLRTAQRLWIQLRDADIAARYPVEAGKNAQVTYGSSYPMRMSGAKTELTRQRTQWLRDTFIDRAEGDL